MVINQIETVCLKFKQSYMFSLYRISYDMYCISHDLQYIAMVDNTLKLLR